jgi:hypothetical protein
MAPENLLEKGAAIHADPEHCVAIGTLRLSIIDPEGGWQPIWNEDSTVCVVCNSEIYNYLELGQELRDSCKILRASLTSLSIVRQFPYGSGSGDASSAGRGAIICHQSIHPTLLRWRPPSNRGGQLYS